MENLIATLRAQHIAVVKMAGTITDFLGRRDSATVERTLTHLRGSLVAHLTLEDEKLYPEMIRLAELCQERELTEMATMFANSMKYISRDLTTFLSRYEGKVLDLRSFEKQWHGMLDTLSARISSEENSLYLEFERLLTKRR